MNEFNKGNFARRAMEMGGYPARSCPEIPTGDRVHPCREGGEKPRQLSSPAPPALWLSKTRLMAAMRKIDPDLAHMIESLAPVYLVKR